jgi:ABC-2 type transport system permease protein
MAESKMAFAVAVKDAKIYYLRPGMIMFGLMMPVFMFFSFSVRREMAANDSLARLMALTVFFTAAAAGPFIIPLERRVGTYDRLLAAPMSLLAVLMGKLAVGAWFAIGISLTALFVGLLVFDVVITNGGLLIAGILIGSLSFSALGLIFGSIPTRYPGDVQMPSTLLRWGLLFVSGVFIPLAEMGPLARGMAYLSPLTYAQDLMNHGLSSSGILNPLLDLGILTVSIFIFLAPSIWLHKRAKVLGY